jgi:hypothetical protein
MSQWLQLHDTDNTPMLINTNHIMSMWAVNIDGGGGTRIRFIDSYGDKTVLESYLDILLWIGYPP